MTIKDIAKLAGVSPGTVSKIINGKAGSIREETRERVLNIVREYHYSPSDFIRSVSAGRSYKLGMLLDRSFRSLPFLRSMVTAAAELGYYPLVCFSDGDREKEEKFLSFLSSDGVDGILWERICREDLPDAPGQECLLINEGPPDLRFPYESYGRFAAEVLIRFGHSRICFISEDTGYAGSMTFTGLRSAMTSAMIPASDADWIHTRSAVDLIRDGYTAAVCADAEDAFALSQQLLRLNYHIPQDFSILVLSHSAEEDTAFSTIPMPCEAYGAFLVSRLVRTLEGSVPPPAFSPAPPGEPDPQTISAPRNYSSKHFLVVGSINTDVYINSGRLPELGRVISVRAMTTSPGGKGVNQAVGLAKLGKEVYLLGRIGSDYDGIVIQDILSKHHVRTDGLIRDPAETGRAFIYILDNGESAVTICDGANARLSVADIRRNSHLFPDTSYCLIPTEIPLDAAECAASLAREHHAKVILKPSSISRISDKLLSMTDYFVPNESEINTLCPHLKDHREQCQYFIDKGVGTVILTLGGRGCYLHSREESRAFPASEHKAVDTTGGCDAFISALAACLSESDDLHRVIHYATYAAGFCVSQLGVVPALIDREALNIHPYQSTPGTLT